MIMKFLSCFTGQFTKESVVTSEHPFIGASPGSPQGKGSVHILAVRQSLQRCVPGRQHVSIPRLEPDVRLWQNANGNAIWNIAKFRPN